MATGTIEVIMRSKYGPGYAVKIQETGQWLNYDGPAERLGEKGSEIFYETDSAGKKLILAGEGSAPRAGGSRPPSRPTAPNAPQTFTDDEKQVWIFVCGVVNNAIATNAVEQLDWESLAMHAAKVGLRVGRAIKSGVRTGPAREAVAPPPEPPPTTDRDHAPDREFDDDVPF